MKVPIYSMKGKASKSSATLPQAFEEPVRLDLIRRAVRAARANRRQAYGASPRAGYRHSVSWNDDDFLSAIDHHCNLVGIAADLSACDQFLIRASVGLEQDILELAVHRLAHDESQD